MEDFEAWVRARAGSLARTSYLLTGDVHLAEDLVQDTLARVADHWRRVSRRGSPDAYARQVMHHLAVDRWRRRRVRPVEALGAAGRPLRDPPEAALSPPSRDVIRAGGPGHPDV